MTLPKTDDDRPVRLFNRWLEDKLSDEVKYPEINKWRRYFDGKREKQMKITKDGKYVTRRDKFPVEILATDMGEAYPVLARYLQPEVGWELLRFDERGRCAFPPVMDFISSYHT